MQVNRITELFSYIRDSSPTGFHVVYAHRVSKNCANLFLSELCQIYTNFDNFWQKDGKEAKIMRDSLFSHLT